VVLPLLNIIRKELTDLEQMDLWRNNVPTHLQYLLERLNTEHFWSASIKQGPTMVLLFINSVLLPEMISRISACERSCKHSNAEIRRMYGNFFFLLLNTVVVPFCGVASVNELLSIFLKALADKTLDPVVYLRVLIFSSPGVFALKYLMNAAFLSTANQLVQGPQCVSRWLCLTFFAVTKRDRITMAKPWQFYWGYWYAWSLSVFALGINMSVACPGTLPVSALFFCFKYAVDKYNFERGVYALGTDIEGSLAVRVVCYLRVIVGFWWVTMGCCSWVATIFVDPNSMTTDERLWLRRIGVTLMLAGLIVVAVSLWNRTQVLHQLRLHGHICDKGPSWIDALAEALTLVRHDATHPKHEMGGSESSGDSPFGASKRSEGPPITWDGPMLLGLLPGERS